MTYYKEYYWKKGKPYGKEPVDPKTSPLSYRIIVDPYYKRFSVEKYLKGRFEECVYDSLLLDFRHLQKDDQQAWQREILEETLEYTKGIIRNQDDRAILIETLQFEGERCRVCTIFSIHGVLLSTHRMSYTALGDPFNGVTLFDKEGRIVMQKTYEIDPLTEEFTLLLSEEWERNG